MFKYLSLLLLACFIFGLRSVAQVYPFVNYTPRDGLVGNKVRFISQDSKGKLYFGTTNGLSVYDGSRFTNYSTENGLTYNMANGIVDAGNDSVLVILNSANLQYIRNGKVRNVTLKNSFCPVINQLIKCGDDHYYAIADEGLFRFEKDGFLNIVLKGLTGANAGKNLYHATELDSFLLINMDVNPAYHPSPKIFIAYNYNTGKAFTDAGLPDIFFSIRTPQNELLLATANGIFSLDRMALRKGGIRLLPPPKPYSIPPGIVGYYLYFDRQQNLWMTADKGIWKMSPGGSNMLFTEQNGLPLNKVSCIFQDREGIMWFGNDLTGAVKLVDQNLQLYKEFRPGFSVDDVYAPRDRDSVWLYDKKHRRLLLLHENATREFAATGSELLHWVIIGKEKSYAANGSTLYQLHITSKGRFTLSPLYTNPPGIETFTNLLMDRNENLIAVGTSITVILPGHKIIRQPLDYFADRAVLTRDEFLYVVTRSMNIYVYKIDPSNPSGYLRLVTRYDGSTNNIEPRSIAVDDSGRLWIGTRLRGLFCYTLTDGQLRSNRQLTMKDGLTDNFVRYLYCDAAGHIWSGTPTGLDKISLRGKDVSIENVTKASNMYLDMHKIEGDRHGVIWAVTSSGLVKVYPATEPTLPFTPEIIFTKITAGNQELPVQQKEIKLKYFQNRLSFQVAVPSFFDEKKILFSYKLEEQGSNNGTWTGPSLQPDISFLNLPPGRYHLKVRSVFSNGKYAPIEAGYSFNILAPWWQSWWFRSLEFLSALLVIIFFFRLYYRSKMQKQRISLEKKQAIEKERSRIAIDMHDDMGAGLSRIKVLSETIKFENQKGIVNPAHLQKISAYSEEMMDKMGEIVWALNQRNDSLSDLLSYMRAYAVDYLTNHGIRCSFHAPADPGETFISGEVRRNIFLSVKEVLHNVIKHAEATSVDISVAAGSELSILIHDNGKGIEPGRTRKFGNGLNNIGKRMIEIGGSAEFKNENGTRVMLKLPIGK